MVPDAVGTKKEAEDKHLAAEKIEKAAAGEEKKAFRSLSDALRGIASGAKAPKAPRMPKISSGGASSKGSTGAVLTFFIIFAFLLHLIDVFVYAFAPTSGRIALQILMGILAWLLFTQDKDWVERFKDLPFPFGLLTVWAIFSVLIGNWVADITSMLGVDVLTMALAAVSNAILTPIWLYYAAFQSRLPQCILSKWLSRIIVIFWVLVIIFTAFADTQMAYGSDMRMSKEQSTIAYQAVGTIVTAVRDSVTSGVTGVRNFRWNYTEIRNRLWDEPIAYASGDYYNGEVDKNAEKELGVYLEGFEAADPELQTDEPVTLYSTLRVQTLDDPVAVSVGCESDGVPPNSIYPRSEFIVDREDFEEDLTCNFEKYKFEAGSRSFTIDAQFNFKTLGYLKIYLMDRERIRSFTRQDIDILDQYKITDKNPVAIYTNGPVMLGMESKEPPIAVDREQEEMNLLLGITLDNSWDGEIKDITGLSVIVPKGMTLIEDGIGSETFCGGYTFTEGTCGSIDVTDYEKWCDDERLTVYNIDQTGENNKLGGTKSYKTLKCQLKISQGDYDKLLGKTPYATHYFRVVTSYIYKISESLSATISEGAQKVGEIDTYECDGVSEFDSSAGLPSEDLLLRYSKYQKIVTDAIADDSPDEIGEEQMEALIAAVMTSMTDMGDIKYDGEDAGDTPDYVTGCMYVSPTARNDARKDIICANDLLKKALKFHKGIIKDALKTYGEQINQPLAEDDQFEFNVDETYKNYLIWLNKLCEKSELKTLTKAPSDVNAADTPDDDGSSITVTWTKSEDDGTGSDTVLKYYVFRSIDSERGFDKVGDTEKSVETYDDKTAVDGTDYYYIISAVSDKTAVNSSVSGAASSKPGHDGTGTTDEGSVTVTPNGPITIVDGDSVPFTVTFPESIASQKKSLFWMVSGTEAVLSISNAGVGTEEWKFESLYREGYQGPGEYPISLIVKDDEGNDLAKVDVATVTVEAKT